MLFRNYNGSSSDTTDKLIINDTETEESLTPISTVHCI